MDPYMLGFYIGMATATCLELIGVWVALRIVKARNAKSQPLKTCKVCDAEVGDNGLARDSLFKLYVCLECMDTVPRRFACTESVPVADVVVPVAAVKQE